MKGLPPLPHLYVKLEHRVRRGNRPCPRCRSAACRPTCDLLGAEDERPANASRRCRLCRVASIAGSVAPRPMRRPVQPRRDHLAVVDHQAVARPQQVRQIGDGAVVELRRLRPAAPPAAARRRAGSPAATRCGRRAGRSRTGRCACLSFVMPGFMPGIPLRWARSHNPANGRAWLDTTRLRRAGMTQQLACRWSLRPHRRLDDLVGVA